MEAESRRCHLHEMHLKSTNFDDCLFNKKLLDLVDTDT